MTPLFGVDYTSAINPAALHAVGARFVFRYLSRLSWKVITRQEYIDLTRAGIYVALGFEDAAIQPQTYAQGKADAEFAMKQAISICGLPTNSTAIIPLAFDSDPHGREAGSDQYYEGAAAVLGRDKTGPYGGYTLCAHTAARGFRGIFQTYAWSAGQFCPQARWYQYSNGHSVAGHGVDFDKAFDLSAFWNSKPPPPALDPRYAIYYPGPFTFGGFCNLNERAIVQRYDTLRATQTRVRHPHRAELHRLRLECKALADRIQFVATRGNVGVWGTPAHWTMFHRKERYRGLIARWK